MKSLLLKFRYLLLGLKNIFVINIGDCVYYKGNRYFVITQSSVYPTKWKISPNRYIGKSLKVLETDLDKQMSWYNIRHAIQLTKHFYITSWHSIFMRIIPMKHCLKVTYQNYSKYKAGD